MTHTMTTLTLKAALFDREWLRANLNECVEVGFKIEWTESAGWWSRTFTITGKPEELNAIAGAFEDMVVSPQSEGVKP